MGWGWWGGREEQREDRMGVKRDRRQCQGIMVCSEAFKNGDDVTQLEMICISETHTPFPRTFGKSATSNGSFFFQIHRHHQCTGSLVQIHAVGFKGLHARVSEVIHLLT